MNVNLKQAIRDVLTELAGPVAIKKQEELQKANPGTKKVGPKKPPIVLPARGQIEGTPGEDTFITTTGSRSGANVKGGGGYDTLQGTLKGGGAPEGVRFPESEVKHVEVKSVEKLKLEPGSSYVRAVLPTGSNLNSEANIHSSDNIKLYNYDDVTLQNTRDSIVDSPRIVNLIGGENKGNTILVKSRRVTTLGGDFSGNELNFSVPEETTGTTLYFREGLKPHRKYFLESKKDPGHTASIASLMTSKNYRASIKGDTIRFIPNSEKDPSKYALELEFKGTDKLELKKFMSEINPNIEVEVL